MPLLATISFFRSLLMRVGLTMAIGIVAAGSSIGAPSSPSVQNRPETVTHHYFKTSDGVKLHYLEAGQGPDTLVFIPGWLMPAAVFEKQLQALSGRFRVLAFDPRSQGLSELTRNAHDPKRRTLDIEEFLSAAKVDDFILAGWSLGVLESLDYVARFHPTHLRGLILIDNSIGEGKPPGGRASNFQETMNDPVKREAYLRKFCKDLYKQPPPPELAQAVVDSALRPPAHVGIQLINQPYPRTYWRETVEQQDIPVLYAVTPRLKDQADALRKKRTPELGTVMIFEGAGHALFVDDATRFNTAVLTFARQAFAAKAGH